MSKYSFVLVAVLATIVMLGVYFSTLPRHELPVANQPQTSTSIKGIVESTDQNTKTLRVFSSNNLHVIVSYNEKTIFRNTNGIALDQSIIQPGKEVTTIGFASNSYSLLATSILISDHGVDTRAVQPDNLFEGSVVPDTYSITGMAQSNVFNQNSFLITVRDAHGTIIDRAHAYAQMSMKEDSLIPFVAWLSFDDPLTATGTVSFANSLSITITFLSQANTTVVKLYYPNTRKASEVGDACNPDSLLPVRRNIPDTDSPIRDTLNLLLKGTLSDDEVRQGFTSAFPHDGFILKSSLLADNGTLTLEFSIVPGFTSGGSCQQSLLADSIRKTALQFPSVKKVIFTPDELFQP